MCFCVSQCIVSVKPHLYRGLGHHKAHFVPDTPREVRLSFPYSSRIHRKQKTQHTSTHLNRSTRLCEVRRRPVGRRQRRLSHSPAALLRRCGDTPSWVPVWRLAGGVQAGCRRSAGGVQAECWRSAGGVSAECRRSAGGVPAGCLQSAGGVSAEECRRSAGGGGG